MTCITIIDSGIYYHQIVVKGFMIMTAPIAANANIQQQAPVYQQQPVYSPSYNAVQINMDTPTVNAAPMMPALPDTATKEWTA